jgi:hypothetical protein
VTELTQTQPTPFLNGLPRDSWWYWFKCKQLELNICFAEGLDVKRTQGMTTNSCNLFYQNLTSLYTQHQYMPYHVWKCDETEIQVER